MLHYDRTTASKWWWNGNGVGHINEVTLHQTQLVLKWATLPGYAILICNRHLGKLSLQPSVGQEMTIGQVAVQVIYGKEGIALAMHDRLWYIHLRTQWPKWDEHPAYSALKGTEPFSFLPYCM